ncbi:GlxA family transcriptional regulator [Chitinophaga cymbidii]|uniref:Transcriptional regulator n=1 Tax=Chitinophaga cymbidii TaxID=1096750 RepID=A0A512REC9_9BACT|nr:helix-turn-helix domain-containing protein [Chitinophaga cymbidii]GEP94042.1 transcriptional regulator [Chitinophaga cymbidii]
MQIGILNYNYAVPTSVSGPADIFAALMRTYPVVSGRELEADFKIDFVTEKKGVFRKQPWGEKVQREITKNDTYDLIIIPAMFSNKIEEVVQKEQKIIEWLKRQHKANAELASICVGSFLLAATGLLDGKKATTNWMFAGLFRQKYPRVMLEDDKIIVDQGKIYSCGGAFSFTTFIIYLIEKYCGHEVAITASKILMINMHQQPQTSFSIFQFQKNHADDEITRVQQYMEANYDKTITVAEMAGISNMSTRNLIRRFEQATGNTPLEYLQRFRIENAKKMLEDKHYGIEQIAMKCGYEDMSFFRKVFKRHVGMTPREYKDKYGRGALKTLQ